MMINPHLTTIHARQIHQELLDDAAHRRLARRSKSAASAGRLRAMIGRTIVRTGLRVAGRQRRDAVIATFDLPTRRRCAPPVSARAPSLPAGRRAA